MGSVLNDGTIMELNKLISSGLGSVGGFGTILDTQLAIALDGVLANITSPINFSAVVPATETTGSLVTTESTWVSHTAVGSCAFKLLCSYAAATGDYATLRIRARSDVAWTGGAVGGVVAGNFSSSANVNDYGNLIAVQGYAQPNAFTQSLAANIVCGLYSCVDRTVASSGREWSLWTDTHATVKATGGHYLHRLSHNGGAINLDGIWSIYAGQGCDYLMNFENTNAPVASGDKTGGAKTYSLAIQINGTVHYVQCYASA